MPRTADDAHWYDAAWVERGRAWHRTARRNSRNSLVARGQRLRSRVFFFFQCAVSAAIAYYVAADLLGHEQPFFAPVAALITLGQSFGQRIRRGVEIVLGVAIGVLVGDLFVHYAGGGYWQMGAVIFVAMCIAALLGSGVLMTTQAGVQSSFVTVLLPPQGQVVSRWTDAVIGGVIALLAATITPASPLRRPRQKASEVVAEMTSILREVVAALRTRDEAAAGAALERARRSESMLDELRNFADDGLAVVRTSPFRRRHLPAVQVIADLLEPLDRAVRNLRVLVRRADIAVHTGEQVPGAYLRMVQDLADITETMAGTLAVRELPSSARRPLAELAERTTYVDERPSLSSEVIRAQVRSIIVDLLMVTGLDYPEACDYVPESFELLDGTEYEDDDTYDTDDEDPATAGHRAVPPRRGAREA